MEHTKLRMLTTGPIRGPHTLAQPGLEVRKRCCQKLFGTQAATAPAISNPMTMSRTTAAHSMKKMWEIEVAASGERSLRKRDPDCRMDMSIDACPSMDPANPLSAWVRASSTSLWRKKMRNSTASRMIMIGPPTNSAAVNCHPISSAKMMPSSMTRLVEAISKAMADVKLAPFRNSERARATAA